MAALELQRGGSFCTILCRQLALAPEEVDATRQGISETVWDMHLHPLQGPGPGGRVEGAAGEVGLLWALKPLRGKALSLLASRGSREWLVFPFHCVSWVGAESLLLAFCLPADSLWVPQSKAWLSHCVCCLPSLVLSKGQC